MRPFLTPIALGLRKCLLGLKHFKLKARAAFEAGFREAQGFGRRLDLLIRGIDLSRKCLEGSFCFYQFRANLILDLADANAGLPSF